MQKNINLIDLKIQYHQIKKEINKALNKVLLTSDFILGKEVHMFEEEFAKFNEVKYAVGVSSGLAALELGMRALGIGPGDEVITPANSFIASSSAISFVGATPVLVDCREEDFNIDPIKIEEKITKKTKAIMPVHLYGNPVDMDEIIRIAKKYNLFIVEDACQAHGARYKNKRVGSFGDISAFSFYPGKNLGAYGDGGALLTNNKKIAEKVRMMRNYGQKEKYNHIYLAWNNRLDSIQAAVLRIKLKKLDGWNQKRFDIAQTYNKLLDGLPIVCPKVFPYKTHVFHLYVLRTNKRQKLIEYLGTKGISTGIHYPIPIHLQKAYANLMYKKGDFLNSEKFAKEVLSLPIYPEMTKAQVKYVAECIKEAI